ncbi:hypothetical protein [Streptomyces sp. XY431]|uniref:hypothetical protein n=1 Tax=Streptomyces sp. XY431 TaxID=1415562 RepID=UPI0018FE0D35|nr:hypothetical protein [Streptomyces sp. XY431]
MAAAGATALHLHRPGGHLPAERGHPAPAGRPPARPAAARRGGGRDLAPHLGSATVRTRQAMGNLAVDNVLAVLAGKDPLTPVAR